jgi:hypothetical protein
MELLPRNGKVALGDPWKKLVGLCALGEGGYNWRVGLIGRLGI